MNSFRVRLILAYTGLLILSFGALALFTGQQISTLARSDYEQRIAREAALAAEGISDYLTATGSRENLPANLDAALALYRDRIAADLSFVSDKVGDPPPPDGKRDKPSKQEFDPQSDSHQPVLPLVRSDNQFTTSYPIFVGSDFIGYIQVRVAASELDNAVIGLWLELALGFLALLLVSVIAGVAISNTLIRPLRVLQSSALRISKGDFSQRIQQKGAKEFAEVANAFNHMSTQVENMLEEQRAFASNASHELRTPLTNIQLCAESLLDSGNLSGKDIQRDLSEILHESQRLQHLMTELTLLTQFDRDPTNISHEEIDFIRFAEHLLRQLEPQVEANHISLVLNKPDFHITVMCKLSHLTVLFRNLLDNAIKYSFPGGTVEWTISVDTSQIHNQIVDHGIGMTPAQLPHIFERFYRADLAHSQTIPGTGLGLSLVKSITDAYHGNINIVSDGKGLGTTVLLSLPVHNEQN